MKKRFISILLVVVMVVAMIPVIALPSAAAENTESKIDYMAYVTNPTFDGKNTNGEYDNAYSIPFTAGLWGATATGNESLRVVYSDDAIYVLLESKDTTDNGTDDFFALSFAVGTSYVATQIDYRTEAPQHTNQGGTVSMSTTWNLNATYFKKTVTTDGIAFEAKFPVANMSAEDQAAFADGTLSVKVGSFICDNWTVTETISGVYDNRTKTTSIISGATALTFAEKYEYDDATIDPVHYVKYPTLDGVNSNGEYDNTYVNNFQSALWSNVSPGTETMKVMYSDDAIYVLFESIDNVANSDDFIYFNYNVGTSFVGNFQSNRTSSSVYTSNNKLSGNDLTTTWFTKVNDADGWSLEAMFPVESMTAEDQAAFAAGTLKFAFSIAYCDAWGGGQNKASQTHSNAYSKGSPAQECVLMPKGKVEDKTIIEVEMPYMTDVVQDGIDTKDEYCKAETIVIDNKVSGSIKLPSGNNGTSSGVAPEGSYYKVIYADDGIYVLINMADTTPVYYSKTAGSETDNGAYYYADQFSITYTIGNSFIGKDWGYRHGTMGATNTGAGTLGQYPGKLKDNNAEGWAYEMKFPYSGMTDEDKAALAAGTLVAEFRVTVADNHTQGWGFNNGDYYTGGERCDFTPAEKGTNYAESVVLDGRDTKREYNTATTFDFGYSGWGSVNHQQSFKVVYAPDAIYVLAEATDSTLNGSSDFFRVHFRIGSTYVGTKLSNREDVANLSEGVNNAGGTKTLPQTSAYVQKYFSDTAWSVEIRFPVADLTAAEREAYAAGTLDMAFSVTYMEAWAVYYMTEPSSSYNNLSAAKLAALPAIEFGAHDVEAGFAGANLSLGENININYYANLSYADANNAFVKFSYNGKTYIVNPIAATDRIDRYVFTFANLAPQCMGDNIKAELIVDEEVVATKDNYSALQNCQNLLANENTPDTAKQLIYDLLAYGAAAQKYAGYKTETLVNAGYEELASGFDLYPSTTVSVDGANTNGEYDGAITVAIDKALTGEQTIGSGYKGTTSVAVPEGSYYKVLFTDDAIYVFVNIADTTPAYYYAAGEGVQNVYSFSDSVDMYYSIGNSFIGYDYAFRHGTMGATNTGAGTLESYPSKQKDNNAEGWSYEIKLPVSGMTDDDKAAYAAGTLDIKLSVRIADRGNSDKASPAWSFANGVIYSDNAGATTFRNDQSGCTKVSVIDKAVSAPSVDGAAFAAAGVYHANANKIYAKVALNGKFDVSAYTVTINGVAAALEETETKGVYIVYTDDVKVIDFDKVYSFVLSDGENSQTLDYSINAYSIIKADSGKTDATKEIAKAMYNYGVSAEAYVAG